MRRTPFRYRYRAFVVALGICLLAVAPCGAQPMTGPIDLGKIDLSPGQKAPSATPAPRTQRPAARPAGPPLDIKAFFGRFAGTGFVDANEADYFSMTQRDLDVQIEAAAEGGFTLGWTTVFREGGDPKTPTVRRRAVSITFLPGPRKGLFRAADNGDPLAGGTLSWAHVAGHTLTVQQFTVRADGRRDSQTYARTLSGTGMDLVYTRNVDGERQRRVRGKLVKNAN